MILRVEGIVIRAVDYGEGNRILHVLTQEAGKISMMARGAKKVKSRFSAISQPFTYGQFVIFRSSSQAMGTINSGELIRSHQRLREDLVLSAYAAYLAELTNRIIEEGEPVPHVFAQLAAAFEAMEEGGRCGDHTCVRDEYVGGSRLYATAPRVRLMRAGR